MKAPTFEQIDPWARRFNRVAIWCMYLGCANNIALTVVRPPLTDFQWFALTLWWAPIGFANMILLQVMVRWATARLRAFERKHPDLWPPS